MRHIQLLSLTLLGAGTFFAGSEASATKLNVGLLAGATGVDVSSSSPSESANLVSGKKLGWGLGGTVEFEVAPLFSIDTGLLYIQRKFSVGNATASLDRSVPTFIIPLEGRLTLAEVVYITAGGFMALKAGSVSDTYTLGSASADFSHDQRSATEFGLTSAVGLDIPLAGAGLFIEVRYNHGLSNPADNGMFTEKMRDVLFMAGVSLGL